MKVETKVTAVTVYRDRAQVTRSFDKDFSRGKYTLIFDQLPGHIDQDSIQINGSGSLVLNDVKYRKVHHAEVVDTKTKAMTVARDRLQARVHEIEDKNKQVKLERQFIIDISKKLTHTTAKSSVSSQQLNPDKWVKMVAFY